MKNFIVIIILVVSIFGVSHMQNFYTRMDCTVVQINDGYATIEDVCGWVWDVDANDLSVGDKVELRMHNNYTERYVNDGIVKKVIKYEK